MHRKIHQSLDTVLIGLGIASIIASVLISDTASIQVQLLLVVVGILLMEAGVWGIARKAISNERQYSRLREEGDHMIELIRKLNGAAVAREQGLEDGTRFRATLEEMHASVRFMAELASHKDGQDLDEILKTKSRRDRDERRGSRPVTKIA